MTKLKVRERAYDRGGMGGRHYSIASTSTAGRLDDLTKNLCSAPGVEVDVSEVELGQRVTVKWRGKPVFIDHRTPAAIAEAVDTPLSDLRDPETDAQRTDRPEWLVIVGVCTHLGCVPLGQKASEPRGEWGGWFCPCHGSQFDTAGRIRKGPAPINLIVPEHAFLTDTKIKIG